MSAETLRRAAALMRERAEAATSGPWERNGDDIWMPGDVIAVTTCRDVTADVDHIASWHPIVALAVADSLFAAAAHIESFDCEAHCEPSGCELVLTATRTARAYLGESA